MDYNKILYNTTKKTIEDLGQPVGKSSVYDQYMDIDYNIKAIVKYKKQAVQTSSYIIELKDQYTFTMLEPVNINWYVGWNDGVYKVVSIDNTIDGIYTMYADTESQKQKHIYSLTINNPNPQNLKVGNILTLDCTCKIDNVNDLEPTITYSSLDNTIASISTDNKITCLKEGTTIITATYHDANATITVNVAKADELAIQQDNISVDNGSNMQLNPICTINGVKEDNPTIIYSVENNSVATCSDNGLVNGVSVGNTTITLSWNGISKTINVVVNAVAVNYEIIGAEMFKQMTQSVYTLNPVNDNCVWSIDQDSIDLEIARIDSQDSTSCTVYGYPTNSGEFFILYAKDGDTILAEKTITIKKNM